MAERGVRISVPWNTLQTEEGTESVTRFLANFYGSIGALFSALLLLTFVIEMTLSKPVSRGQMEGFTFICLLNGMIYYGLTYRKSWALSLNLYLNGACLSANFYASESLLFVMLKPIAIAFSLFQLWFFTRPQTRKLFNEMHVTLF